MHGKKSEISHTTRSRLLTANCMSIYTGRSLGDGKNYIMHMRGFSICKSLGRELILPMDTTKSAAASKMGKTIMHMRGFSICKSDLSDQDDAAGSRRRTHA